MGFSKHKTPGNETEKQTDKRKKIIIITTICACIAVLLVLTPIIIRIVKYNKAGNLIETNDYISAYELLVELDDYKDSNMIKESIKKDYQDSLLTKEVGSTLFLGSYEQDNNLSNGSEDVEWIVLAKEDTKLLVISRYALDCQPYDTSGTDVTWETCSLRGWLNETFLNAAFTAEEQPLIATTTISADKNPVENAHPGNPTQDQIFLLSIPEAENLLTTEQRACEPTAYAKAQGSHTVDSNDNCWWWLRSPGYGQRYAAYVYSGGGLSYRGHVAENDSDSIRPALWIDLNS